MFELNKFKPALKISQKIIILFILTGIIPIILIAYFTFESAQASLNQEVESHLISIADLKKNQIELLLYEFKSDISIFENHILSHLNTLGYVNKPSPDQIINDITDVDLNFFGAHKGYGKLFVLNTLGEIVHSTDKSYVGKITNESYFSEVIQKKWVSMETIPKSSNGDILLRVSKPIYFNYENSISLIGFIVLEIDVERTIYPLILHSPGMGKTGETLLGAIDDNEILFLNELKHKPESMLNLRVPLNSELAKPMTFAVLGYEGIIRAKDYRNVDVLAAYRHISHTDWGFVAKIDSKEAFLELNNLKKEIIMITIILIVLSILLANFFSRTITKPLKNLKDSADKISKGNLAEPIEVKSTDEVGELAESFDNMRYSLKMVIDEYEKMKGKEELVKKLEITQEQLKNYKKGFESSPDCKLLIEYMGGKPHIRHVNRSFTRLYGYQEKEVLGKNPRLLKSGMQKKEYYIKMWKHILDPKIGFWYDGIVNKKKNGSYMNINISIATIFNEKKEPVFFISSHTDITESRGKTIQLEKFVKLSVGREEKMIELKKKIKELEKQSRKRK